MHTLLRPLAVFGASSLASLGVLWFAGEAPKTGAPMQAVASSAPEHRLSRLRVVREALAPVRESYVEPARIQPDRMFAAALDAVEHLVPGVMFDLQGDRLSIHVGAYRTLLVVPPIDDLNVLERELRRVAGVLEDHLHPDDIPGVQRDIDPFAAIEFAMGNGMLATLDPHSSLLPPEQSREMDVENSGKFGGLGINIEVRDDRLLVDQALPDRPAARAGVQSGDHIRRIDGQSTINLTIDEAVDLLRGPVGADVVLEVVREGLAAPLKVVVTRENIKINEVEGFLLASGMAYVRIPSFHATVHRDLNAALKRMAREEGALRGLVLDLRDNPGGYLNQAIAVADTFLDDGEIVATRGPHDRRAQTEHAHEAGTEDAYPIVVLVNANSASASEIVAGALRNNQRAVIVGERTFGKGSVQNLHALPLSSKLKITIAHYLTPGERSIQSVGIPADIELVPAVVGVPSDGGPADALLYGREMVQREADLDAHLDGVDTREEAATYRATYLTAWTQQRPRFGPPDLTTDPELDLAVSLLQVAPRAHRGDMLAAAGPLVRRYDKQQDGLLVRAMAQMGLDWTAGPTPKEATVDVALHVEGDGALHAGQTNQVVLRVTNQGSEPIYRAVGVVTEHEALVGAEFFLGQLLPGQTRSWTRTVHLDDSWPAETVPLHLNVRDGAGAVVGEAEVPMSVTTTPSPRLAWAWTVEAPDDGRIDAGDRVRIRLSLSNVGEGPSRGATARIRNRAGKALDILSGTIHAGQMRDAEGAECAAIVPGWDAGVPVGDDQAHPRVVNRLAPSWPEGCRRVLDAGATWTGSFEVDVIEALEGGYRLDLSIEDTANYDQTAIVRRGLYDYFRQEEPIEFSLGSELPAGERREPPRIEFTRVPGPEVHADLTTISGRVVDADGLAHVVMWADDDKVFYEGRGQGPALSTLPFTADIPLTAGVHRITVLARDAQGFTSTSSRVLYRPSTAWQAQARPAHP